MTTLTQVGDPMPPLSLELDGGPFSLPTSANGTIVYFMRTADCPVCRAHVRRLIHLASSIQAAGLSVVVVVPDAAGASSVALSLKPPFPVVAGRDAHRAVGLGRVLFGAVQQSGTLVVDSRGVVTMVVRATMPTGAFPEDDVFKLLEAHGPAGGVAHAR